MELIDSLVTQINGIVWGPLMLVLILGTGFFLQVRLKFMPIARIGLGFRTVWGGRKKGEGEAGEISPFAALMTALAATVGTGSAPPVSRKPRALPTARCVPV